MPVWLRGLISIGLGLPLLAGCQPTAPPGSEWDQQADAGDSLDQQRAAAPLAARRVALGRVRFVEGFRAGYDQALQDGRPMLVFFTAEWCHFCHQMADEVFSDPEVVRLASQFTCIVVDADAEPETCQQMRVEGFPTIQFLTPRGAPLNRLVGKRPSKQLVASMQEALQTVARRRLPSDDVLRR